MSTPLPLPLRIGHWSADDDEQGTDQIPAVQAPADGKPEPGGSLIMLQGGQMTSAEQVREAIAHAIRVALLRFREARKHPGGLIHGLLAAKPRSVLEQCEYAQGRAWVPAGKDGGLSEGLGVVFHAVIGRPGTAIGNIISGLCGSPLRSCAAAAISSVLTLSVLTLLHLFLVAAVIAGMEALAVTAWFGAAEVWVRVNALRMQRPVKTR